MTATTQVRRTRDADRSRELILDAAERLFSRSGYDGTSLQDIGDAAGVSRGTPSYFFGSKEGLYRAVIERCFDGISEMLRREREAAYELQEGPDDVLAREIAAYIGFLSRRPHFVRLLQWETLSGAEMVQEMTGRLLVHHISVEFFQEEAKRTRYRDVDPVHLILNIAALCWFPFAQQDSLMRMLGTDAYAPEFVEKHKREVVRLVLDGIRAR